MEKVKERSERLFLALLVTCQLLSALRTRITRRRPPHDTYSGKPTILKKLFL